MLCIHTHTKRFTETIEHLQANETSTYIYGNQNALGDAQHLRELRYGSHSLEQWKLLPVGTAP